MAATARACSLSGVSTAVATCALFAASFALAACGECLEPRGAPVADDASADAGIRAPDAGRVVVDAGPAPDDALPPNQSLAGGYFSCAFGASHELRCWGREEEGTLGPGGVAHTAPAPVAGLPRVTRAATGLLHACALAEDASVWCWGWGSNGQLGRAPGASAPARVAGLSEVVDVAVGGYAPYTNPSCHRSCALTRTGAVYCWGEGASGELGNGGQDASETPVLASVDGVATSVSAGAHHTCVRTGDGKTWCWGRNVDGQVDEAPVSYVPTPRAITGLE